MKTWIISLLLTLSTWVFGQAASPENADEATAGIDRLREALVTSFNKGDIDGLLSHLAPDVVVTWQNAEVCRGPEAVRSFYHRMMTGEKRIVREIKSAPEVLGREVHGDWAVSWGNLHDHFVLTDGSDLPFHSVFTATTARRGDRWVVVAFHASVSAFENPVQAIATRKVALWLGAGGGVLGFLLGMVGARLLMRRPAVE